jgi:hypothetical protein
LLGICSAIYINEEANDVVQAILKHFDENPQDARFEQVIFIPSDKCHLFPKVCSNGGSIVVSSARRVQVFHGVVHEGALLPTLLCCSNTSIPTLQCLLIAHDELLGVCVVSDE